MPYRRNSFKEDSDSADEGEDPAARKGMEAIIKKETKGKKNQPDMKEQFKMSGFSEQQLSKLAEAKVEGLCLTSQVLHRLEFIKHEDEPEEPDNNRMADWIFEIPADERDKQVYFTYVN